MGNDMGTTTRLALGTAQFGLDYGIANKGGRVPLPEARRILERARAEGVVTLDTAAAYGGSEAVLGTIGVADFQVVTKLPALPPGIEDPARWVRSQTEGSLGRLRVPAVHGLLLHRPSDLLGPRGGAIYAEMARLQDEGFVRKLGVSIYSAAELDRLAGSFALDIVQAPLNILDRRLVDSGWLQRLRSSGVEVHTRSAFLQGLLLLRREELPPRFARWAPLWDRYAGWLRQTGLDPAHACLRFVLAQPVDRVIIGADRLEHFVHAVSVPSGSGPPPPEELSSVDEQLIDPSTWGTP
jgi:aryl-alcohol dehydrogenase-like predicted oxidoreductase